MSRPEIVCVMPTKNRRLFVARAIHYFERATVHAAARAQLVIVDGGTWPLSPAITGPHTVIRCAPNTSIGTMRNMGMWASDAPYGFDLDDDDFYSSLWLSISLEVLLDTPAGFCGCSSHSTYDMIRKRAWHAQVTNERHVASGATFGFTRELWKQSPFPDSSDGEDHAFLKAAERLTGEHMGHVPGEDQFVYVRHALNVTGNFAEGRIDVEHTARVRGFFGRDVEWYDAMAEMMNGGEMAIRRRDWFLPAPAAGVSSRAIGCRR